MRDFRYYTIFILVAVIDTNIPPILTPTLSICPFSTTEVNNMPEIKVGDYLFKRLRELGIGSVFGVPGGTYILLSVINLIACVLLIYLIDYELALLDLVTDNELMWKGNPNELIASYAADGYARVNGAAAFVTTFGPGELSAYCGMAGQYCEYVPVVHIVGYPTVAAQASQAIMHHSLGDGRFE